ncbi:MAG: hypothetical protein GEU90_21435 [Gemmatimonas sp.]|nr:hypothetical protein [Gemmatimonas sp.]
MHARSKIPKPYQLAIVLCLPLMAGCGAPPPPPPPPPPPAPVIGAFASPVVWTAEAGVRLDVGDDMPLVLERPFIPLITVGRDDLGLLVQCDSCEGEPIGYVDEGSVVYEPLPPEVAAWGSLAEFALSVREAAASRDLDALRTVMAFDFTSSLLGPQHPDAAFAVWRDESFASLDGVPSLLADGLAPLDDGIWSAPLAFIEDFDYRGLRLGFRRSRDGRWEWLYLMRGTTP